MGTSSMYGGHSDNGSKKDPLLPRDFEDNDDNDEQPDKAPQEDPTEKPETDEGAGIPGTVEDKLPNQSGSNWQNAKSFMTKYASGNSPNLKGAISSYVKARGGAKSSTKTANSGIRSAARIGHFITSVASNGFAETLNGYKIEFRDRSAKAILSDLINYLVPSSVTKEDIIARKALIITMEFLYEYVDQDKLNFDKIDIKALNVIIPLYVECYIYERLINDLGSRLESSCENSDEAIKIEQEIKDYVKSKVDVAFKGKDLSQSELSKAEVEALFNQCYTLMEDMI